MFLLLQIPQQFLAGNQLEGGGRENLPALNFQMKRRVGNIEQVGGSFKPVSEFICPLYPSRHDFNFVVHGIPAMRLTYATERICGFIGELKNVLAESVLDLDTVSGHCLNVSWETVKSPGCSSEVTTDERPK